MNPPTREDAQKIVAQKRAQKATIRIVKVTKPKQKKKKGKRVVTMIQMPLSLFVTAVVLVALVIGLLLAWQITGFRLKPSPIVAQEVKIYGGYTLAEIDDVLAGKGLIKKGEFLKASEKVCQERGLPFSEGWFLSGVYLFDGEVKHFAMSLQDALNSAVKPYLNSLDKLSLSLAEIIIVASMVQRETNDPTQMPLIAAVIYNRLLRGMPLGIDATTRYGLKAWDRALVAKDFNADFVYDTRRRVGLPPTGIGSPTPEALEAAFNPAKHDYFYYLHDSSGAIHLSRTYEEHKEKIAIYLN
ncbi:MAG: endolytic transglycosylase MltG [Sphaerochaetaceae bacterium]